MSGHPPPGLIHPLLSIPEDSNKITKHEEIKPNSTVASPILDTRVMTLITIKYRSLLATAAVVVIRDWTGVGIVDGPTVPNSRKGFSGIVGGT